MNNQDSTLHRSYYAIIPADVRYDKNLTASAKLLYAEITALCNDRGYCWASNDYFATLYGVSKTSISKWISQLVNEGYLETELVYKEGTKIIQERRIYIANKKHTPLRKVKDPIEEKLNRGIEEKLKDNNKVFNNKNNRYNDKKDIQPAVGSSVPSSEYFNEKDTAELTQEIMDAQVENKKSVHPLTRELISRGIITEHDGYLTQYNKLFFDLLNQYDYEVVATALNYTIARMKDRDDIGNKFAYLKTSIQSGIDKQTLTPVEQYRKNVGDTGMTPFYLLGE